MMGLGAVIDVKINEARGAADDARKLLRQGVDPIEARRAARAKPFIIFEDATEEYIKSQRSAWGSDKQVNRVRQSLKTFAFPVFGKKPVDLITANDVVKVLDPIWATKSETAGRIRTRIEGVLNWSKSAGYISGDNVAGWKGNLEHRLVSLARLQNVQHREAVPHADAPALFAQLVAVDSTVSRALRFIALTAVRAGAALHATWAEFDLDAEQPVWTIPALPGRKANRKTHRVPLAPAAVAILREMQGKHDGVVFRGAVRTKAVTDAALRKLLRKYGPEGLTTHGWRSTFRDWCAEVATTYPSHVAEAALGHELGNKVTTAYLRTDAFNQRVGLMKEWATFLTA